MKPFNPLATPLLTDMYQVTMAYAYWKNKKADDTAVFELFFRDCPFGGEFAIFAGLTQVLAFVEQFRFSGKQVDYLRRVMAGNGCEPAFFDWLATRTCRDVRIYAPKEGSVVFPKLPLLRVEGPLGVVQLLETPLLNLVNFATLITTNAMRFRLAAGKDKQLLEFGLRRAQGPDGAVSASTYACMGGFDATSNLQAGYLFDLPVKGTHAHSFVTAYASMADLDSPFLRDRQGQRRDFAAQVLEIRDTLGHSTTNEGELAAFISYAQSFPKGFLALVDTYDTLKSGVPNFLCVAVALAQLGYQPIGIRLDSGDLAYLSKETHRMFEDIYARYSLPALKNMHIVASNNINEDILLSLHQQGHKIDIFGIGTHLATCQSQPALGGVFKLVELNGIPRIKLSDDKEKITLPGRKQVFRLIGKDDKALLDVMLMMDEPAPVPGQRILCRHPFEAKKRVYVVPTAVTRLLEPVWQGEPLSPHRNLTRIKAFAKAQIDLLRPDHVRFLNPTPYRVSLSEKLYTFFHELWEKEYPIDELH